MWDVPQQVPGQGKLRGDSLPSRPVMTGLGLILNLRPVSGAPLSGGIRRGRAVPNWAAAAGF